MTEGAWLNTDDAAQALGLSRDSVLEAIRKGTLRATRRSRRWRISPQAVEEYRNAHLGRQGWEKRKASGYEPDVRQARYARTYRDRLRRVKAQQDGYGDDVGDTITGPIADLERRDPDEAGQLQWAYQGVNSMIEQGRLAEMPDTYRACRTKLVRLLTEKLRTTTLSSRRAKAEE